MSGDELPKPAPPLDNIEIEISPIRKVTQLINGTVAVTSDDVDRHFKVGNTGLKFSIDDVESGHPVNPTMDFLPENRGGAYALRARPTFIFGFAFYEFYKYAQANPDLLAWNDMPVEIYTNETMAQLIESLLKDFVSVDEEPESAYTRIELDLGGVLSLPENDTLITRLKKLHNRAQKLKIEVPVEDAETPLGPQ